MNLPLKLVSKKEFFSDLNPKKKLLHLFNLIIFIIPIAIFGYTVYLRYEDKSKLDSLGCEDCLVENIQVGFYAASFLLSLIILLKIWKKSHNSKRIFYGLITIIFFLWTMEEISWGQRIFDWKSGQFFSSHNEQKETTLHNMKIFGYFLDRGFLYIGVIGTILSISHFKQTKNKLLNLIKEIKPGVKHFSYFFVITIIYFVYLYLRKRDFFWWADNMNWRELEVGEMILSISIFLILAERLYRAFKKNHKNS